MSEKAKATVVAKLLVRCCLLTGLLIAGRCQSLDAQVIAARITIPSITPDPVGAGSQVTISYRVYNDGSASRTFGVGCEIMQGTVVIVDLGPQTTPSIAPASSWSGSYTYTVPSGWSAGTYTARVAVWSGTPGASTWLNSYDKNFTVENVQALSFVTTTDSVSVPEAGTAEFGVKLSAQPSETVTASVSRVSGDTDISVKAGSMLTFTTSNWSAYQLVTLAATEDADSENGSATIRIHATSGPSVPDKDVTATEGEPDGIPNPYVIGQLSISWTTSEQVDNQHILFSGHISINDALQYDGNLSVNTTNFYVSGDGLLYIEGVPFIPDGRADLFSGEFVFDAEEAITDELNAVLSVFEVCGLDISVNEFRFLQDGRHGVTLTGLAKFPVDMGGVEAAIDELTISTENGIELVGEIVATNIRIGTSGFCLREAVFTFDTPENKFEGSASVAVPTGFVLEGEIGFWGGYLNMVGFGADNLNIVVLTGPPPGVVPIVYLQRIHGQLDELRPDDIPVILRADTALTLGPQFDVGGTYVFAVRAELAIEIDTGGRFTGTGDLYVITRDGHMAGAKLILDVNKGVYMEGGLYLLGVLDIEGKLKIDLSNNLQGLLEGACHVPQDWPLVPLLFLGSGDMTIGYVRVYVENDYMIFAVKVGWMDVAVEYNKYGEWIIPANMSKIHDVTFDRVQWLRASASLQAALAVRQFEVAPDTDNLVVWLEWTGGDLGGMSLVDPTGTVITAEDAQDMPDELFYEENAERKCACFLVKYPPPGLWQVNIGDDTLDSWTLTVYDSGNPPWITGLEVQQGSAVNVYQVSWLDDDAAGAEIAFYVDSDASGYDGSLVTAGVPISDSANVHTLDLRGLPEGLYFLYAKVDDYVNVPQFVYVSQPVQVVDPEAPAPPTNVQAAAGDGEITVAWEAGAEPAVVGYRVYFATSLDTDLRANSQAAGNVTSLILRGLRNGLTYRVAVVAYDESGRESALSDVRTVALESVAENNPPNITSIAPTQAVEGVTYLYDVEATDVDAGDQLRFSLTQAPLAMTIDGSTGLITWTPSAQDLGNNQVTVRVSDESPSIDDQTFTVRVANSFQPNLSPEIVSVPPSSAVAGQKYSYQVLANDVDGDVLTYALSLCPDGTSIDEEAGLLEWTPASHQVGPQNFVLTVSDGKGGEDVQNFTVSVASVPSGGGGGGGGGNCFVATAAYGTACAEQVRVLSEVRDRYLMTTRAGCSLVRAYYRLSPPLAKFIARHESARAVARAALSAVVVGVRFVLGASTVTKVAAAFACCVLLGLLGASALRRRTS